MQDSDHIVSDEEVSTNKERHSRLGEDNLDDTLEYDFSGQPLRVEETEELQTKDSGFLADQNVDHEFEAKAEKGPDPLLMTESVPLTPVPETPAHPLYTNYPNSRVIFQDASVSTMKDSVEGSEDKT